LVKAAVQTAHVSVREKGCEVSLTLSQQTYCADHSFQHGQHLSLNSNKNHDAPKFKASPPLSHC
jgi:hypothetical protein